jgi:ribonucleoside-diphosphate reductase alpha chain
LRRDIHLAVRFLDNTIDASRYPLPQTEAICRANRKIGLGVMGFADMLLALGIPYSADEALTWGERLMRFINEEGHAASAELAAARGVFPNWPGSLWETRRGCRVRNATVTTVAPAGTLSIIANCSGGIEPIYSVVFRRHILEGRNLLQVHPYFEKLASERGFYSQDLLERIASTGTLTDCDDVPPEIRRVFVCASQIDPQQHVGMQAAFQRHCDAAISKTVNFPNSATAPEVDRVFRLAFRLGCKGITVYRDGCRRAQPMALTPSREGGVPLGTDGRSREAVVPDSMLCPRCGAKLAQLRGCRLCENCGYAACSEHSHK